MSIADGQVVLQRDDASGAVSVNPQASISRIGSRAYPPALADLAVQLRFELAQVLPLPGTRSPSSTMCSSAPSKTSHSESSFRIGSSQTR